jgi:hypothetical protein
MRATSSSLSDRLARRATCSTSSDEIGIGERIVDAATPTADNAGVRWGRRRVGSVPP